MIKRLQARFADNKNVNFFQEHGLDYVEYFDWVMALDPSWGYDETAQEIMSMIRDYHLEEEAQ